ncbi:MAG: T9SS type A sorting domain-containing protein [Saprospiraceae bacterium]|nr:T9SS type A sorting domain-containing protein [Saprospiraceae bacterium]
MMRISTFKTTLQRGCAALLFTLSTSFLVKADVGINIVTSVNGDVVTAEVLMYNFQDIISQQYSIVWNPAGLAFDSVGNFNLANLQNSNFGISQTPNGILNFSWFDQSGTGITLPDCSQIYTITFHALNGNVPQISIASDPVQIEVVTVFGQLENLIENYGCSNAGQISGHIFNDLNNDCQPTANENGLEDWKVKFEGNGITYYHTSDAGGAYKAYLQAGNYTVSLLLPQNGLWTACAPVQNITVVENGAAALDFPAQALFDCPAMTVDLSSPFLRRCFNSNYYVHYCNNGTEAAQNAYVEVTFDPFLEVQSSSIPWSAVSGNTYTFPLGNVGLGECGDFYVDVVVSCDAVLGQTHCSEAHIYPDANCIPLSPLWDGSDLEVTGTCDGDSVRFLIVNKGDDMAEPAGFIVIEDDMVYLQGQTLQLEHLQSTQIAMSANGSTWRLEAAENAFNPYSKFAAAAVEGCGTNGSGTFSVGFVTQFPVDDNGATIDEDCRENIGSYDPNDKTGYPRGFCASHFIQPNTDLEYLIRFQNTGTDTAFTVVVLDTLSGLLDPASVVPGAASHSYDFELLGNGVVRFAFENIMLPDSNVNEAASHGFVKFRVSQAAGNQPDDVIRNKAAIVFDFNEPVITNEYFHTVGNNFVEGTAQDGNLSISGFVKTWYGEPLENVEMKLTNTCPVYTDENGYFVFNNLDTANYALSGALENVDIYEGVTVLDYLKIRKIILFLDLNANVFQIIAANLGGNGNPLNSLTTFDLVKIPELILRKPTSLSPKWGIVTAEASNSTQLSEVKFSYQYSPLSANQENQDFKATKGGNVILESMVESSPIAPVFEFDTHQTSVDTVTVDVKVSSFTSVAGYQFGLKWDPAILEFLAIKTDTAAVDGNAIAYSPIPGQLSLLHINAGDVGDGATIFTLKFLATGGIGSSTLLELDESNLPFQVVVEECKLAGASMQSTTITLENPSAASRLEEEGFSLKIAPNPAMAGQPVVAEIKSSSDKLLTFTIFSQQGSALWQKTERCPAGTSRANLSHGLPQGVYLLRITDANGLRSVLKMSVL